MRPVVVKPRRSRSACCLPHAPVYVRLLAHSTASKSAGSKLDSERHDWSLEVQGRDKAPRWRLIAKVVCGCKRLPLSPCKSLYGPKISGSILCGVASRQGYDVHTSYSTQQNECIKRGRMQNP